MEKYYVVRRGHNPGIYSNYQACQNQLRGYSNNEFRRFYDYQKAYDYYSSKIYVDDYTRAVFDTGKVKSINQDDLLAAYGCFFGEYDSSNEPGIVRGAQYSLNCLNKWKWFKNGWRTSNGRNVKNQDIIQRCLYLIDSINDFYDDRGWYDIEISYNDESRNVFEYAENEALSSAGNALDEELENYLYS
ncbi:ribonuclease H family protein ASCRUDRAFT_8302 [Ascoidea rubescens DSM 1968]|uniref:Ribonuclease H1 N-terminal domain-containing protein n=1 Tax=Ascoidea rubescens DSM 1968 TaxID=1344418 RepID=A0A1D2VGD6_9ASCO|nr:hypothetical protein ASCRUDRAFT_8302 [Ascoidea rubescens DSM 1968]ODV60695.1 hypothetical protein ASCRUDRAFT_8302 [Ascoidea rubescens DSM 1968]